ncbi:unnamed protein product [Schistosoma turkestanicum]|nr:unnamed protein product [Schistosoma turkestanicum]
MLSSAHPINRLNVFRNLFITQPLTSSINIDHDHDDDEDNYQGFNSDSSQFISSNMLWIDKTNQSDFIMDFYVPYNGLLVKFGPFFHDNPDQHILFLVSHTPVNWLHLCIVELNRTTSDKHW